MGRPHAGGDPQGQATAEAGVNLGEVRPVIAQHALGVDGADGLEPSGDGHAMPDDLRVVDGLALDHFAPAHLYALAGDDGQDVAFKVADDVVGDLWTWQVLLDDGIGHVVQEEGQFPLVMNFEGLLTCAAEAGFDEDWVLQAGIVDLLGEPGARRGYVKLAEELIGQPLIGRRGCGLLRDDHQMSAADLEFLAIAGQHKDVRVNQGEDQVHLLPATNLAQGRNIGRVIEARDEVRAVGLSQGRCQGVNVHSDNVTAEPQVGVSSLESPQQFHPTTSASKEDVKQFFTPYGR